MNIYLNRIKCVLRNKGVIFWSLAFPIIMACLFKVAFNGLFTTSDFETIKIGLVENGKENTALITFLDEQQFGEKKAFEITRYQEENEDILVKESSYLIFGDDEVNMYVKSSGLNQSITKTFIDEYVQNSSLVYKIMNDPNYEGDVIQELANMKNYTVDESKKADLMMNYFYTLIAMTIMFGSMFSMEDLEKTEANMSTEGMRVNIAPTRKLKVLLSHLAASFTVMFIELLIYIAFLYIAMGISFGSNIGIVLLLSALGTVVSLAFGLFLGVLIPGSAFVKSGIATVFIMLCSVLSGMVAANIKFLIYENAKFLHYINPCSLITDSFYSVYLDGTSVRLGYNMLALSIMGIVFLAFTYIKVRRVKYESL